MINCLVFNGNTFRKVLLESLAVWGVEEPILFYCLWNRFGPLVARLGNTPGLALKHPIVRQSVK